MNLAEQLPAEWRELLAPALQAASFRSLSAFLEEEYAEKQIFPPLEDLFSAFRLTPPDKVRVLILGQDPYHNDGQAHGLAFSVRPGVKFPPSLRNIFKELNADLGTPVPESGSLDEWAKQGVLLLNTVLTVRAHQAFSHRGIGWEQFTDAAIKALNTVDRPIVFMLWGKPAGEKAAMLDNPKHLILKAPHPSPLSASRGFFGCGHFVRCNEFLTANGIRPINWQIPDIGNIN